MTTIRFACGRDKSSSSAKSSHEVAVVNEFCRLLNKSKQLFIGLRDLPQYGRRQWQNYFGQTFHVYTRLWKFQQQHRVVLDHVYGLQRWQIGEIASKIGQLYYHYYLRTSDLHYLYDAFSFYWAIRTRAYYCDVCGQVSAELIVKKLRFYARFIVVCLLLKKMRFVDELAKELDVAVMDYCRVHQPRDYKDWQLVLQEIELFVQSNCHLRVYDRLSRIPVELEHRLTAAAIPPLEHNFTVCLHLTEIIIVGSCCDQVKFSELTLDMFRILQTVERLYVPPPPPPTTEARTPPLSQPSRRHPPLQQSHSHPPPPAPPPHHHHPLQHQHSHQYRSHLPPPGAPVAPSSRRSPSHSHNPHKYLLYKPSFAQFNAFLATSYRELPAYGALLVYISADGAPPPLPHSQYVNTTTTTSTSLANITSGYTCGGVATANKRDSTSILCNKRMLRTNDCHCIHPADLFPYTRKPLFVIIDSDHSFAFKDLPNLFGQPLVCFMSPEESPANLHDKYRAGNLFTLFLHCPVTALCSVCNIHSLSSSMWDRAFAIVDRFICETDRILMHSHHFDHSYLQFYGDDFMRLFILRFCFCSVVLHFHRSFGHPRQRPLSHPALPMQELLHQPRLHALILDLAALLNCKQCFTWPDCP